MSSPFQMTYFFSWHKEENRHTKSNLRKIRKSLRRIKLNNFCPIYFWHSLNVFSVSIRLIFKQTLKCWQYSESSKANNAFYSPSFHLCSHLFVKSNNFRERDHSCFSFSCSDIHFYSDSLLSIIFPEVIEATLWSHFQLQRQFFFLLRHSWILWCLFPRSYFDSCHVDRQFDLITLFFSTHLFTYP